MRIPLVDPTGYDVIMWKKGPRVYFAETKNSVVYRILENRLPATLESFPEHFVIGIYMPDGSLGRVGTNRLQ